MAGATLAILAPSQAAQAVIIDFQSLEQNNSNGAGFTYTEDGFTLDNLSTPFPFAFFGTQESRYPGSTALFNNTINGITRLTQNSEGLFGSSGFCVETRSILIEYPQNSLKSLVQ